MNTKELTKLANDAYYAANYAEAIQLYRQILEQAPKNNNARKYLAKAELNLSLGATVQEVPVEAIQLYKRSRSFITAGDLQQAKKMLEKAILIAKKAGAEFSTAQDLLEHLSDALTAEGFKKRAFDAIDTKLWLRADAELNFAIKLDPTDEIVQTLSSHLGSLLRAQRLISRLEADIETTRKRSEIIKEIHRIIDLTNQTTTLSTLWQEVVRLLGEYENKNRTRFSQGMIGIVTVLVIASGIMGGVSAQNYWSPGAYIALIILATALIISVFTFTKK